MENYDTIPKNKKKKINRILYPYLQKKFKIEKKIIIIGLDFYVVQKYL